MWGDTLYPLNQLATVNPELYEQQAKKYKGREHVMKYPVPILDCLWNDVLHFSLVHPREVKHALVTAGQKVPTLRAFEIVVSRLEPHLTVLYRHLNAKPEDNATWADNFVTFDATMLATINHLPQHTKAYYAETVGQGKRPLIFMGVPHILYKGSLNVAATPVIEV